MYYNSYHILSIVVIPLDYDNFPSGRTLWVFGNLISYMIVERCGSVDLPVRTRPWRFSYKSAFWEREYRKDMKSSLKGGLLKQIWRGESSGLRKVLIPLTALIFSKDYQPPTINCKPWFQWCQNPCGWVLRRTTEWCNRQHCDRSSGIVLLDIEHL